MTRAFALYFAALLIACAVHARGGDGGDYSGDGSSSSSGSDYSSSGSSDWGSSSDYDYGDSDYGDGEGDPFVGFVMVMIVMGIGAISIAWSTIRDNRRNRKLREAGRLQRLAGRPSFDQLRTHDPNFSPVLFRAFAHLVYVKFHESRGGMARRSADEFAVSPFLAEHLRQAVRKSKDNIAQVIVGHIEIDGTHVGTDVRIDVTFKSNVVYKESNGRLRRMLMHEQLTFARGRDVLTREPELVLALGCPSCGSKQEIDVSGRCPSCGQISGDGRMDWQVVALRERSKPGEVKGSVGGASGPERGTDLPTVMDPDFKAAERSLRMRDPSFTWSAFAERAHTIFMKLQEGWSEREESILRPFELDHVFDTHRIWLQRYREEGVRNVLKDIKIEYIKPVKIQHDAWFDSITARIRARMVDFKQLDDGRHLSGSRTSPKEFTEYFTFVRRNDCTTGSSDSLSCPQCGGPLDRVSQVGICGYCDTRITTGRFDWVLAEITQDEEYDG